MKYQIERTEVLATSEETLPHESKLYTKFSYLYDKLFYYFPRHIAKALRMVSIQPGEKILEIGVGTGLSLGEYPNFSEVTAVDVAPKMLEKAEAKIKANGWDHISLQNMNALKLDFPDNSFDHVTAFHVVTVIPHPERLMQELSRVCKPKGKVILINHFCGESTASRFLYGLVEPISRPLGWSSTLKLSDLLRDVPLKVERKQKTSTFSIYTIVIAENDK